jgi:hypothetical protein
VQIHVEGGISILRSSGRCTTPIMPTQNSGVSEHDRARVRRE